LVGLCAGSWLVIQPAAADDVQHHTHHRHVHSVPHARYQPTANAIPPSAGFGPTYPGVSTLVMDAASGRVISEHGADIPRYPASLTKLMTLDLAFQALRGGRLTLDTPLPVSAHAAAVEPVKLGLRPGSTITVRQAILAMTTMSANDAATALGEYLGGGSETRAAEMMNLRARTLGMAQTRFANCSGLPNPTQVTTARDLAILARDIVINFPEDQHFFEVENFVFNGRTIYSNNGMLKLYPGTTGMKTGYTNLARHNLLTTADHDGRVLIGVTLHEPSWGASYTAMAMQLNNGFDNRGIAPNVAVAAAKPTQPATQPLAVAAAEPVAPQRVATTWQRRDTHPGTVGGWTAQLGVYTLMSSARIQAIEVQKRHGVGVARIARLQRHGHTLWKAQLAGLTLAAAHQTCDDLAARRTSCLIIAPSTDHLASLPAGDGDRT
jgi:D-alanyl-D-alanine carboxypeptidase